jgi:hypothetical protein
MNEDNADPLGPSAEPDLDDIPVLDLDEEL